MRAVRFWDQNRNYCENNQSKLSRDRFTPSDSQIKRLCPAPWQTPFLSSPLSTSTLSQAIHLFPLAGGGSTSKCNLPQMLRKHQLSLMDCEREINVYNYVTGAPKVAETSA